MQYGLFRAVSFVAVQYELYLELCLAVSLLCNVSCFSVCKLFLVGSFITVHYLICLAAKFVTGQYELVLVVIYYAGGAVSGSVIYYCAM